ncbi:hypothetical protein QJ48_04305 [Paenibacillus sp. A3]|uniref:hypothetical protein n=1 Tax=Paenibacillus sp. A3 TaxID=1337054 RepID=UPI0006D59548|nr:hypothetical protein [Paenibacillus sp. A3]KPV60749.1 hypothetical protein QJ48_04305 [Paenibacillus sp. A3]
MKKNRWHVYEWLKQSFMFSGQVPTIAQVRKKFAKSVDPEELVEGIIEFVLTVQLPIREYDHRREKTRSRRQGA